MASLDNCFVDRVIEPVVIVDVASDPVVGSSAQQPESQNGHRQSRQTQVSTLQQLTEALQPSSYSCRVM
jgi:hypothetical protein